MLTLQAKDLTKSVDEGGTVFGSISCTTASSRSSRKKRRHQDQQQAGANTTTPVRAAGCHNDNDSNKRRRRIISPQSSSLLDDDDDDTSSKSSSSTTATPSLRSETVSSASSSSSLMTSDRSSSSSRTISAVAASSSSFLSPMAHWAALFDEEEEEDEYDDDEQSDDDDDVDSVDEEEEEEEDRWVQALVEAAFDPAKRTPAVQRLIGCHNNNKQERTKAPTNFLKEMLHSVGKAVVPCRVEEFIATSSCTSSSLSDHNDHFHQHEQQWRGCLDIERAVLDEDIDALRRQYQHYQVVSSGGQHRGAGLSTSSTGDDDVDALLAKDDSLIHLVCRRGKSALLRTMLEEKWEAATTSCIAASSISTTTGRTPLHVACWRGHWDCVALLIEHCHDLLYLTDKHGYAPLDFVHTPEWQTCCDLLQQLGIEVLLPKQLPVVQKQSAVVLTQQQQQDDDADRRIVG